MSYSPFADYANALLTFVLPGTAAGVDPVSGNRMFGTGSTLIVAAMLSQSSDTRVQRLSGTPLQAVYLTGRVTGLILEGQELTELTLPNTLKNEARSIAASWGDLNGEFAILRRGRSAFGVDEILGDRLQGWFEIR